jgi:hypothetical protein
MRKIIAISVLSAFAVLHYGKMVSWLYCELRIEMSDTGKPSCDCEKILQDKQPDSGTLPSSHSHNHKEKLSEPFNSETASEPVNKGVINTSYATFYSTKLLSGFIAPLYHPPSFA